MLRDATIVVLSSIDWSFNWQIPQDVASALAADGNRVLFVENTGIRMPTWKDRARLRLRLANWWAARGGTVRTPAGVDVCSPVLVPLPYSPVACRLNAAVLLRTIRRWISQKGTGPVVVITFLPSPLVRAVIRGLTPEVTVYYVLDRLAESSPSARPLQSHEDALLADADLVFTTAHGLLESAAKINPCVSMMSSGVRFEEFERAREFPISVPDGARGLRRPIVGYVGSVRNEVDLALLARAARLAPDLSFLIIGPIVADVGELAGCSNVHFVGPVPHDEVIRYLMVFDVGIIPYVQNRYTAHILPFKLKEYLAAGLPIVTTGLPEIRRFVSEHGDVVAIADDAGTFVTALRNAIASDGSSERARRVKVAKHYDWPDGMKAMSLRMAAVLAMRHANNGERRLA